jgi:hypothetical protein
MSTLRRGGLLPKVTSVVSCHPLLAVRCWVFSILAGPAWNPP